MAELDTAPAVAVIVTVPATLPAVKLAVAVPPPPVVSAEAGLSVPNVVELDEKLTLIPSGTTAPVQSYTVAAMLVVPLILIGLGGFKVTRSGVGVLDGMPAHETVTLIALLVIVPLEAVMVTGPPGTIAVTSPVLLTVATPLLLEDQINVTPVTGLLEASSAVALSCCVPPTANVNGPAGVTVMDATVAEAPLPLGVGALLATSGLSLQPTAATPIAIMPSHLTAVRFIPPPYHGRIERLYFLLRRFMNSANNFPY
ncbi:MAG: hypothetical protein AABY46_06175 [Nitrospirota bacterium]